MSPNTSSPGAICFHQGYSSPKVVPEEEDSDVAPVRQGHLGRDNSSQNLVGAGGRSSRLFVARAVHELVVMVVAMKVVMMVVVMVMTVVSSHAGLPKLGGAPPSAPLLHSEAIPGQQF